MTLSFIKPAAERAGRKDTGRLIVEDYRRHPANELVSPQQAGEKV
jgi:hypothetical protein